MNTPVPTERLAVFREEELLSQNAQWTGGTPVVPQQLKSVFDRLATLVLPGSLSCSVARAGGGGARRLPPSLGAIAQVLGGSTSSVISPRR